MSRRFAIVLTLTGPALAACATTGGSHAALPDYAPYSAFSDETEAATALAGALERAQGSQKKVLAIFGADWCHDSRTLASWLQTPRFQALTDRAFEIVYINAGHPQGGKELNMALAAKHGVSDIAGTPSLLVLAADGRLLNTPEDAKGWRNAASRGEAAILSSLEAYALLGA